MAERITGSYTRLFEVRLLHHYWLDDGGVVFDKIADPARRNARLLDYGAGPLFAVTPSPSALAALGAAHCIFKTTPLGFVVGAPTDAVVPADTMFSFVVSIADGQIFDYTALTFRPQQIYELFDPTDFSPDRTTYRYKDNVPVLSNLSGTKRTFGADTVLFLSREIPPPAASDAVESLVQSAGALLQLTGDNPGAATQLLAAQASDVPVFVNQGDVPAIVPPDGVTGVPARGVALGADVADNVFMVISLTAVRADDDAFSFVDGTGAPKPVAPIYEVRFKNRSTVWTYLDKQSGSVLSAEASPLPLTYFGNAGTKQKPSRGIVKAQKSGERVTQLISEIYV